MMKTKNEIHEIYMQQRQEIVRCKRCLSLRIYPYENPSYDRLSINHEGWYCTDCERDTGTDVETIEEWAERVNINLEEQP